MIAWLSSWAQGIIVAVIIATIAEMILPKGTIKKYVKVVVGVYILFSIISPIIEKVSNGKFNLNEMFDTSSYAEEIEESSNKISQKLESNNSKTIKDIYIDNIESDIKYKLKQKDYEVSSIYVKAADDENYTLEKIKLNVLKNEKNDSYNETNYNTMDNEIESVNIIEISVQNNNSKQSDSKATSSNKLSESDKKTIRKYLADEYSIKENIIELNS